MKLGYPDEKVLYKNNITTCLLDIAMGYRWEKSASLGGRRFYLCPKDDSDLCDEIRADNANGQLLDREEIAELALYYKMKRLSTAFKFLSSCDCDLETPSLQWVSLFLDRYEIPYRKVREIEPKRYFACPGEEVMAYHQGVKNLMIQFARQCIYNMDEFMLSCLKARNAACPKNVKQLISKGVLGLPYISALLCHNMDDEAVPSFFVLPGLRNLPLELDEFSKSCEAFFASSPKGWATREIFLLWTLHLTEYLERHRKQMCEELRDRDTLLLLDGNMSRECPLALSILRLHRVHVYIFPSHCTHVYQPFDIGLAGNVRKKFSKYYRAKLQELEQDTRPHIITQVRYSAIKLLIVA